MKMVLVADIGNTNINFGIFKGKILRKSWSIPIAKAISVSSLKRYNIKTAIICSVVPDKTKALKKKLKTTLKINPLIAGVDVKVPVKNLYRNPKQVGQDRLVNAYAAWKIYGGPLIIVDFGTAITFDAISKSGSYLGGIITPGVGISLETLFKRCALLPRVKFSKPKSLIGKDTKNSILSGIVYGYGCLCDGIILKLKKSFKNKPLVVSTGGSVELMRKFCGQIDKVDKNLTLKGLNLLTIDRF